MSERRTIRLTAAQWQAVDSGLFRLIHERRGNHLMKQAKTAEIAREKIRAAKGAK